MYVNIYIIQIWKVSKKHGVKSIEQKGPLSGVDSRNYSSVECLEIQSE